MAENFNEYDEGFRLGTFDKCNGRDHPRVEEDGSIYAGGYYDAWASNENQMPDEDEDTKADRMAQEAYAAGEVYAREIHPTLDGLASRFGDFREDFIEGFIDQI